MVCFVLFWGIFNFISVSYSHRWQPTWWHETLKQKKNCKERKHFERRNFKITNTTTNKWTATVFVQMFFKVSNKDTNNKNNNNNIKGKENFLHRKHEKEISLKSNEVLLEKHTHSLLTYAQTSTGIHTSLKEQMFAKHYKNVCECVYANVRRNNVDLIEILIVIWAFFTKSVYANNISNMVTKVSNF